MLFFFAGFVVCVYLFFLYLATTQETSPRHLLIRTNRFGASYTISKPQEMRRSFQWTIHKVSQAYLQLAENYQL